MVAGAIAPRPAAGDVEHRELLARKHLAERFGDAMGLSAQGRGLGGQPQRGIGVMGGEQPAGERDIGEIAAIGVERGIQIRRRTAEREPLNRAGG